MSLRSTRDQGRAHAGRTRWIARAVLSLAIALTAVTPIAGCSWGRKLRDRVGARHDVEPTFRLAFVTDLKGYLEPCGCTTRQLGGIDRLAAQLAELRGGPTPVLFVAAGDLFFADSAVVADRDQQDRWKAETVAEVLRSLDVTAITPGASDGSRGDDVLVGLAAKTGAPLLAVGAGASTVPAVDHVLRTLGRTKVGFLGVSDVIEAEEPERVAAARASVAALRAEGASVVVALVRGDRRLQNRIADIEGVTFVVGGGLDQEIPNAPAKHGAFVLHGGRQGQRLGVVDVHVAGGNALADASEWTAEERRSSLRREIEALRAHLAVWEQARVPESDLEAQRTRLRALEGDLSNVRPPRRGGGNWFAARIVELESSMPQNVSISRVLTAYDARVNDHNRVALASVEPPPPLPGTPTYVGSSACATCHESASRWWRSHPHGNAYATLVKRHKEFNLDCVGCHVTGYDRPGGSNATHLLDGALANVGCESCHGPGSEHVARTATVSTDVHRNVPSSTCLGCHNTEHSDGFDYEMFRRRIVVPGHGLPEGR